MDRHKNEKSDEMLTGTKQLREWCGQMLRNGTPTDNIEYSEVCKEIQQNMKKDIRKHDKKQIINATNNRKSLKQAKGKQCLEKGHLSSVTEEDGTHIHDRLNSEEMCRVLHITV